MNPGERIAALGEAIYRLKDHAQQLTIYGESQEAHLSFTAIPRADRALFLYLAMLEGSDDSRFVATYLGRSMNMPLNTTDEVCAALCQEDRLLVADHSQPLTPDARRIERELRQVRATIGDLKFEEAYWILVRDEAIGDSEWIPIGQEGVYSNLRSPFVVMHEPTTDVRDKAVELVADAASARWLLHVHNHPEVPGYLPSSEPSDADYRVVAQWRSLAPALKDRMRFFVVTSSTTVEYGLRDKRMRPWTSD